MLLTVIYLLSNIAADVLYVPQLIKLIRHPEAASGLSLTTWLGWTFTSTISLGYMYVNVDQWPVLMIATTNFIFQFLITLCIFRSSWMPKQES